MKLRCRFVFGLSVWLLGLSLSGCESLPAAEPLIAISPDTSRTAEAGLGKCVVTYALLNPTEQLRVSVDSSFLLWVKGFPTVTYQSVAATSMADIQIQFAPVNTVFPPSPGPAQTLVPVTIPSVSVLQRRSDGRFLILLRSDYKWQTVELVRTLAFQIGRCLGVGVSTTASDIMYPYFSATQPTQPRLSSQDSLRARALYPVNCNGWTVRRDAPQAPFYNPQNIYALPVAFSLGTDTLYVLWPDAASRQYIFYKVLFAQNPADDRWLRMPGTLSVRTFETIRQPVGIFAFSAAGRGYVGAGQLFAIQNDFWEYDPARGTFDTRLSLLQGGNRIYSGSFTIGNQAYVYNVSQFPNQSSLVWPFDPTQSGTGWLGPISIPPETIYTQTVGFATQDRRPCLYTGYAAYFLSSFTVQSSVVFDQSNPAEYKAPRLWGNEQSFKTFTLGNSTYLIRDNFGNPAGTSLSDLWLLRFNQNFADYKFDIRPGLPAEGRVLLAVGHKNRGYAFTSAGRVYEYTP